MLSHRCTDPLEIVTVGYRGSRLRIKISRLATGEPRSYHVGFFGFESPSGMRWSAYETESEAGWIKLRIGSGEMRFRVTHREMNDTGRKDNRLLIQIDAGPAWEFEFSNGHRPASRRLAGEIDSRP